MSFFIFQYLIVKCIWHISGWFKLEEPRWSDLHLFSNSLATLFRRLGSFLKKKFNSFLFQQNDKNASTFNWSKNWLSFKSKNVFWTNELKLDKDRLILIWLEVSIRRFLRNGFIVTLRQFLSKICLIYFLSWTWFVTYVLYSFPIGWFTFWKTQEGTQTLMIMF